MCYFYYQYLNTLLRLTCKSNVHWSMYGSTSIIANDVHKATACEDENVVQHRSLAVVSLNIITLLCKKKTTGIQYNFLVDVCTQIKKCMHSKVSNIILAEWLHLHSQIKQIINKLLTEYCEIYPPELQTNITRFSQEHFYSKTLTMVSSFIL